jgi:GTPase involved in cell partitioning and DNA repair
LLSSGDVKIDGLVMADGANGDADGGGGGSGGSIWIDVSYPFFHSLCWFSFVVKIFLITWQADDSLSGNGFISARG